MRCFRSLGTFVDLQSLICHYCQRDTDWVLVWEFDGEGLHTVVDLSRKKSFSLDCKDHQQEWWKGEAGPDHLALKNVTSFLEKGIQLLKV